MLRRMTAQRRGTLRKFSAIVFLAVACRGTTEPNSKRLIAGLSKNSGTRILAPDTVRVGAVVAITVLTHVNERCHLTADGTSVTRSGNTHRIIAYIRTSIPSVTCPSSGYDNARQHFSVVFPAAGIGILRLFGRGGGISGFDLDSLDRTVVVVP